MRLSSALVAGAGAAALAALLVAYYILDPATGELFPKCVFHSYTGLDCPSCGNQRALHAFLHGHLAEAVRYNLFALLSVPYFVAVIVCTFCRSHRHWWQRFRSAVLSRTAALTYVALFFAWWIVRNLPL